MNRRVILAGGGHAHLAVLSDWARTPLQGTARWLVTPARRTAYSGMLPGWMAGIYRASDLLIDLKPLADRAGATLVLGEVIGLDATRKRLGLSSGAEMEFDLLSLAIGGETEISSLSMLGDRLLPVRPVGTFMERWTAFLERQAQASAVNLAVVGGGAAGVELVLAGQAAIRGLFGHARISLVTPDEGFLSGHAPQVRRQVLEQLAKRNVDVHFAEATSTADGLLLSDGHFLPVDCAIAATGSRAPPWLSRTGLACTSAGFVAVGADMRSTSHHAIFAAGDIIDRIDRRLERSGVHAVKAGPVLAANLRAAIDGTAPARYHPRSRTLYLLSLGDKRAILSWGKLVTVGKWAWRIKDWIDRRFIKSHRVTDPADVPR